MSAIAKITVGNQRIFEVDADPSVSGFPAPQGSLAMHSSRLYIKYNVADTDWRYIADQNDISQAVGNYIPLAEKAQPNGVATLDANGKLVFNQIPAIAITDTFVVASEAAMLALATAEKGDVAVRTDLSKSFILTGGLPSVLANWQELLTPADRVLSVNGKTGIVVLGSDDIAEGITNLYFTEARVRATLLTGFSDANQTPVVAADSLIVALGKLQGQINKEVADRIAADNAIAVEALKQGGFFLYDDSVVGPVQLTASIRKIVITGVNAKEVRMPDTSTLEVGSKVEVYNYSAGLTSLKDFTGAEFAPAIAVFSGARIDLIATSKVAQLYNANYTYLRSSTVGINIANRKMINLADPTLAQDAVNKQYLEANAWRQGKLGDLSDLNVALAASYFGTKAGSNFDISLVRNGVIQVRMGVNMLELNDQHVVRSLGKLSVIAVGRLELISETADLLMSHRGVIENIYDSSGVLVALRSEKASKPTIANGDATKTATYTSPYLTKSRVIHARVHFGSTEGEAYFEKTIHISASDAILLVQDDFTNKAGSTSPVNLSIDSFSAGVLTVSLSGMSGLTNKFTSMTFEEEAMA